MLITNISVIGSCWLFFDSFNCFYWFDFSDFVVDIAQREIIMSSQVFLSTRVQQFYLLLWLYYCVSKLQSFLFNDLSYQTITNQSISLSTASSFTLVNTAQELYNIPAVVRKIVAEWIFFLWSTIPLRKRMDSNALLKSFALQIGGVSRKISGGLRSSSVERSMVMSES